MVRLRACIWRRFYIWWKQTCVFWADWFCAHMDERRQTAISLTAERHRGRQPWEPHKTCVFSSFIVHQRKKTKGCKPRTVRGIALLKWHRARTIGLDLNPVKRRFCCLVVSLNEITLQAEQAGSCCFCSALITQPRRPRPCSCAHKVNTSSLPRPGNVATSVRPRNSLSNHYQFPAALQWAWRSVARRRATVARFLRLFWGFKDYLNG